MYPLELYPVAEGDPAYPVKIFLYNAPLIWFFVRSALCSLVVTLR
jgi:hypothetical protein